jgi:ribosomal protein L40E
MNDEPQPPELEANSENDKAPVRVCPNCSAQSQTSSDTCPHCGASFIRSRKLRAKKRIGKMSKRNKIIVAGIILGLLIGGITAGVIAKVNHDNQVAQQHKEEQELVQEKQEEKAEEEKLANEELESEEELERIEAKYGRASVNELEEAITKDANGEAEEGFSEYVSETSCEAEGGRVDTTLAAQNFSCLAVTSEEGGLQEGYRYTGTINYEKGEFSWRFGGP